MATTPRFDHEKLNVYHEALTFVACATERLEHIPKRMAVYDQLDRSSTAIPLSIAEGTGKFTSPDRCRYYDTARGSALECAACLDVLVIKKVLDDRDVTEPKAILIRVVSMLVGLIKSVSPSRVYDEADGYFASLPEEQVKVKEQDQTGRS